MKKYFFCYLAIFSFSLCFSQTSTKVYPEPEFLNEVYALNNQSNTLVRLDPQPTQLDTKTKLAGFGGSEIAYNIPGEASKVRFSAASLPSFVYQNAMGDQYMDPARSISLYALNSSKGERKLLLQASGGAFGSGKKASKKYVISFKKIKDGYYEILVDKQLPKGEYAFMNAAMGTMNITLFVFGVD